MVADPALSASSATVKLREASDGIVRLHSCLTTEPNRNWTEFLCNGRDYECQCKPKFFLNRFLPFMWAPYNSLTGTVLSFKPSIIRNLSKKRMVNVVLLEDLAFRGFAGEEVAVKPGYARNFLIPGRKAVYATHDNKLQHMVMRSNEERTLLEERRDFLYFKSRTMQRAITFTRNVAVDGQKLEHPLTKADLAAAMRKQLKRHVDEQDIWLPKGSEIKMLGELIVKVAVDVPLLMVEEMQESAQSDGGKKREMLTVKVAIQKDEKKRDRRENGSAEVLEEDSE